MILEEFETFGNSANNSYTEALVKEIVTLIFEDDSILSKSISKHAAEVASKEAGGSKSIPSRPGKTIIFNLKDFKIQ